MKRIEKEKEEKEDKDSDLEDKAKEVIGKVNKAMKGDED